MRPNVRPAAERVLVRARVDGIGGRRVVNRIRMLLLATLVPLLVVVGLLVVAALHASG